MPGTEPTNADRPDPTPREVAGYRLLRRVGEGGMSTVFLSYDVATDRPVAVKLLADHLAHSREFVSRFYREARLCRLLSHPNLVRGLAAGFDPDAGKHYLILEFVDGPTAHTVLARHNRLPVGVAVQVGLDIARALAFLHTRQYVHRDVKPDNILLHPDGLAKLADLGLAKRLNDDPQLTSATQGVGTPYYMAYEQAMNANLVDGRSDVFALGATLYHLLTGEVPFPGATHEEVIRGKEEDEFRPTKALRVGVPTALAGILAVSLARDPRARFQSAGELADALAATGFAAPIPRFDPAGDGDCVPGGDSPTRADLKTPDRSPTTRPGPVPLLDALVSVRGRPGRDPESDRPPRFALGLLAGCGLAGAVVGGALALARLSPGPTETDHPPRMVPQPPLEKAPLEKPLPFRPTPGSQ